MATIPVPVPASVLVDRELTRRAQLKQGNGNIFTGCREIDEYVLLGGFERGSVVGVSCEDDEVGLLIGLQTVARLLVTAILENEDNRYHHRCPRVTIITMSPVNVLVPKLRQILVNQLASHPAGLHNINTNVKRCLEQISISMVFDIEGLQEVLGEIHVPEETTPPVQEPSPVQPVQTNEQVVPTTALISTSEATNPPPARVKTEIRDSEDEDEDEHEDPVVRSESSSPLSDPPEDLEDLYGQDMDTVPIVMEAAADTTTEPQPESQPPPPPPPPPPKKVNRPPDLILTTHMTSLLNALFTGRDKPAAHETMSSLSLQLRGLARQPGSNSNNTSSNTVSSGPLIMLLNSTTTTTSSFPYKFDNTADSNNSNSNIGIRPAGENRNANLNAPPTTERSVFHYSHHEYAGTGAERSKRTKPSFGMVFSQLLDLLLLCTRIPRRTMQAPFSNPSGSAWVVEVLLDEVGVYEIDYQGGLGEGGEHVNDRKDGAGLHERELKIRRRCREQRWCAVEVEDGGGGRVVDVDLGA